MIITKQSADRDDHSAQTEQQSGKGENREQCVTSGSFSAQPTPPHLPQTTYQSG